MPRAIWSGAISFGLINIPVKLFTAVSPQGVRFNQIDRRTGSRVRQRRVSEADGTEVAYADIVKGYELASGRYVVITEDELAALDPKASRTIDLIEFVDQASIDPIYYDAAYHLGPDEATTKPYALLARAMTEAGKVGIARMVMHGKQHLCALRAIDGRLLLSTMRYADEIRSADDLPGIEALAEVEIDQRELAMAGQLIASLDTEFDAAAFHDDYRAKVLDLIERKASGEEDLVETPASRDNDKVVDLMAALEASVAEAKKARTRHPTAHPAPAASPVKAVGPKKAAPAKRPAAKKAAAAVAATEAAASKRARPRKTA